MENFPRTEKYFKPIIFVFQLEKNMELKNFNFHLLFLRDNFLVLENFQQVEIRLYLFETGIK